MGNKPFRQLRSIDDCPDGLFGRAAQQAYLSQPSLSEQIRKLEVEWGVPLFKRLSTEVSQVRTNSTSSAIIHKTRKLQSLHRCGSITT
jgi:Bacterial regulatory helix-turn-helix protein, lysR family